MNVREARARLASAVPGAVMSRVPNAYTRLVASNRFYQVISLWEAAALHGNGAVPTITETLRGDATGFRDQTWPRRLASVAFTAIIGFHLLGGYPRRYLEMVREYELAQARAKAAAQNGGATRERAAA